jgi:hypothetical protein
VYEVKNEICKGVKKGLHIGLILVAIRNREKMIIKAKTNLTILAIFSDLCMYQIEYNFITLIYKTCVLLALVK